MRSLDVCDLAPGSQFFWRDVVPVLSFILGQLNLAVVGSRPNLTLFYVRWANRVNHPAPLALGSVRRRCWVQICGYSRIFARQIRADGLPGISAILRSKQNLRTEIENMRIERR